MPALPVLVDESQERVHSDDAGVVGMVEVRSQRTPHDRANALLEASLPPRCLAPGGCEGSRHLAERVCPRHDGVTSWPCQPTGPRRRRGRRRPEGSSVSSSASPAVGSLRACRHESHGIGPVPSSPTVLERADTADTAEGAPASGSPLASSSCDPVPTGADGSGVRARERVVVASARHWRWHVPRRRNRDGRATLTSPRDVTIVM